MIKRLGIGAVAGLAFAGCATAPQPSVTPTAGPTISPSGNVSTPASTPASTAAGGAATWVLDSTLSSFEAADVSSADGRAVAVGCAALAGSCSGAAIAVLESGQWIAAQPEGNPAEIELHGVAAGAAGLVAVGRRGNPEDNATWRAVVLVSDDGRFWRAAPDNLSFHGRVMWDVAPLLDGGWIAVGRNVGPTIYFGFETWISNDGLTWKLVGSEEQSSTVSGVTVTGNGLIAWGSDCLDVCGPPQRATLWTSGDGSAWVRVPDQPSLERAYIDMVMATPSGALAVGSVFDVDGNGSGAVWTTADGATWERRSLPDAAQHQSFRAILGADGFTVSGASFRGNDSTWGTWSSPDGAAWTRLSGADIVADRVTLATLEHAPIAIATRSMPGGSASYVLRLERE